MSLPSFIKPSEIPTSDQAIASIILSVAMEEMAISHILEAESEKINYIIEATKNSGDITNLIAVNDSVNEVLKSIIKLQAILKTKLEVATNYVPPTPTPMPFPRLEITPGSIINQGDTPYMEEPCNTCPCSNQPNQSGISIVQKDCETRILLPQGKTLDIQLALTAENRTTHSTKLQAEFRSGESLYHTQPLEASGRNVSFSQIIRHTPPIGSTQTTMALRVMTPEKLHNVNGSVTFMEVL